MIWNSAKFLLFAVTLCLLGSAVNRFGLTDGSPVAYVAGGLVYLAGLLMLLYAGYLVWSTRHD